MHAAKRCIIIAGNLICILIFSRKWGQLNTCPEKTVFSERGVQVHLRFPDVTACWITKSKDEGTFSKSYRCWSCQHVLQPVSVSKSGLCELEIKENTVRWKVVCWRWIMSCFHQVIDLSMFLSFKLWASAFFPEAIITVFFHQCRSQCFFLIASLFLKTFIIICLFVLSASLSPLFFSELIIQEFFSFDSCSCEFFLLVNVLSSFLQMKTHSQMKHCIENKIWNEHEHVSAKNDMICAVMGDYTGINYKCASKSQIIIMHS